MMTFEGKSSEIKRKTKLENPSVNLTIKLF